MILFGVGLLKLVAVLAVGLLLFGIAASALSGGTRHGKSE